MGQGLGESVPARAGSEGVYYCGGLGTGRGYMRYQESGSFRYVRGVEPVQHCQGSMRNRDSYTSQHNKASTRHSYTCEPNSNCTCKHSLTRLGTTQGKKIPRQDKETSVKARLPFGISVQRPAYCPSPFLWLRIILMARSLPPHTKRLDLPQDGEHVVHPSRPSFVART